VRRVKVKKWERLFREILHSFYSRGERFFVQTRLCSSCSISAGAANRMIAWLEQIGAVERKPQGFRVINPQKILLSWAVKRNLMEDVVYSARVFSLLQTENLLRGKVLFTAHCGYKLLLGENPGFEKIFAYGKPEEIVGSLTTVKGEPNLFLLEWDEHLAKLSEDGKIPLVQLYVDLWQIGADRLLEKVEIELEKRRLAALERLMAPPSPQVPEQPVGENRSQAVPAGSST
jgi:hypothetical protein